VNAGGYFGAGTIETVRIHVDLASSQVCSFNLLRKLHYE
jgi:hypothetical protein